MDDDGSGCNGVEGEKRQVFLEVLWLLGFLGRMAAAAVCLKLGLADLGFLGGVRGFYRAGG